MTIPGIGSICAMAVNAFAPPMESFGCGRDFAAWVGLTPRQHSTAGKQRLGRIAKMGQRDLRQLLVLGRRQFFGICAARGFGRSLAPEDDDGGGKPPKLVAVPLRTKWRASSGRCRSRRKPTGRQQRLPLVRNSYPEEKGCLELERRALRTRS